MRTALDPSRLGTPAKNPAAWVSEFANIRSVQFGFWAPAPNLSFNSYLAFSFGKGSAYSDLPTGKPLLFITGL